MWGKTFWIWMGFLLVTVLLFEFYQAKNQEFVQDFDYSQFVTAVQKKHVKDVLFYTEGASLTGEIRGSILDEFQKEYKGKNFRIEGDVSTEARTFLKKNGIIPNYKKAENSFLRQLFAWLPLLVIVLLFVFMIRQFQGAGQKAFNFGKSKARLMDPSRDAVTFKDVAGIDEGKEDLQEVVSFLKYPERYTKLGAKIPRGILLVGAPGTGKTLLARAVSGEAKVPFFSISGSDFVEMFVGVGASRVRDLFTQGKKNAPCIIFIDEIDAVGRHRGAGLGGGHDEREQTLNQLLVEMDGFQTNSGIIVMAATNRPDVLDPALLRPGRFDRRIVVNKPDLKGREAILKIHAKGKPMLSSVDMKDVARGTGGFSGADLANLLNEAALRAATLKSDTIHWEHIDHARDKIMMGSERKSFVLTEKDKRITAYHEAGHTLVSKKLPEMDPIHKVTIIPRGMALGVTQTLPEKDEVSLSESHIKNLIAFLFGGRAAEEIIFKDVTTGASNDIERLTDLARSMVCEWGMGKKIGPIALEKNSSPVFLGMQNSSSDSNYSEKQAALIDQEVTEIINEGHKKALDILKENRKALERLAEGLLEFETISGKEVDHLIDGGSIQEIQDMREAFQKEVDEESDRKEKERQQKEEELASKEAEMPGEPLLKNPKPQNSGSSL